MPEANGPRPVGGCIMDPLDAHGWLMCLQYAVRDGLITYHTRTGGRIVPLCALGLRFHDGEEVQNRYVSQQVVQALLQVYSGAANYVRA